MSDAAAVGSGAPRAGEASGGETGAGEAGVAAASVVAALRDSGLTVAVAESLTGGLLAATLVDVPGASQVLRGAVVAYATDLKHELLGVDADLLRRRGAVDGEVAVQMACGVRRRLGADYGVATTGVAGPDSQDGQAPGTVYVAVAGPQAHPRGPLQRRLHLPGDRGQVRRAAVRAALAALQERLDARTDASAEASGDAAGAAVTRRGRDASHG